MSTLFKVSIHSDINEFPTEKRYTSSILVGELKKKLELITGANHTSMKVSVFVGDKDLGYMENDDQNLGDFVGINADSDSTLKFVVKDDASKDLLKGDVPKYTISEEKYTERKDNVRNFIKEMKEKRLSNE